MFSGWRNAENLAFEEGERVTKGGKNRCEVKGKKDSKLVWWLQMPVAWIAWEKSMQNLVNWDGS